MGVPVVQPRHGAFPEIIDKTGGGLLVNPHDPEDLARGLIEASQFARRTELSHQGWQRVRSNYNEEQMALKTIEILESYLN